VDSWLWTPDCGLLAVDSWLWTPGCGLLAVDSWLWTPGCGLLSGHSPFPQPAHKNDRDPLFRVRFLKVTLTVPAACAQKSSDRHRQTCRDILFFTARTPSVQALFGEIFDNINHISKYNKYTKINKLWISYVISYIPSGMLYCTACIRS
jgi:hypothetical protein